MYYPGSENKDADQLRGYREADLRLCFRPCKLLVFSRTGSYRSFFSLPSPQENFLGSLDLNFRFAYMYFFFIFMTPSAEIWRI